MDRVLNVCHISTFPPTQCGIATYVDDLITSLPAVSSTRIRLAYNGESESGYDHSIPIQHKASYAEAARYINESDIDVVSLQHENGIYGGDYGALVLKFAYNIRKPIVTTLHTVRPGMGRWPQFILQKLAAYSSRVVVLTEQCAETLISGSVPASKIEVVQHGIPEVEFRMPDSLMLRQKLNASTVFVSAGHLRPSKGYDLALQALAKYKQIDPHFKYLILGTDQQQSGGAADYRSMLRNLIAGLRLEDNVVWADAYLSRQAMLDQIMAADVGLVTYRDEQQTATGILPMFLGCGRPVVATSFACARSLHNDVDGLFLAKMDDPDSIFRTIVQVTTHRQNLAECMARNYRDTRDWTWPRAGERYKKIFEIAAGSNGVERCSVTRSVSKCRRTHLTIAYLTNRKDPRIEWFFDSLDRETGGNYLGIKVVVVDLWANSRSRLQNHAFRIPKNQFQWASPKPSVWQGPHRFTKQDWFAASNSRNTALCLAPDGWIAFVDDLSVLMPGWLSEVRSAMAGPRDRIMLGAYRKVKGLIVKDGNIVSFADHPSGHDNRWPYGNDDGPVECAGNWLYGCSLAAPVEAFLSINGFDESCDGMGFEDCIAGIMLAKKGYKFAYNRRMLTYESEELHHQFPVMKRLDYGVSPNDKSHALLDLAMNGDGWAANYFSDVTLRSMRAKILDGESFPIPEMPQREFFTGTLLSEL